MFTKKNLKKPLIIGLGNPGIEYKHTRHNVGFMLCETFGKSYFKDVKGRYKYLSSDNFTLIKPNTYMNKSGIAVRNLMGKSDAQISDILVVCDDFNLPFGKLRLRKSGSAGGHNGLKSIIDNLGSADFARLRLGIGEVESLDAREFVLQNFAENELEKLDNMLVRARQCVAMYVEEGVDTAMNRFN